MRLPAAIPAAMLAAPAASLAAALCLALSAGPAPADEPVGAEAFEAYTTGKTLIYGNAGGPYGIEEYLPGRQVRWSFLDGDCVEGTWFPEGEAICFRYEAYERTQCWLFFQSDTGLTAQPLEDPEGSSLYEVSRSKGPMICKGPEVGV